MANYNLILDTHFKPFTYAEMLAPIAAATEAHQNLEKEYGALEAEANLWDKIASEEPDSKAAAMYRRYIEDLHNRADILMRQGLSPESRRSMLNMKARYSNEITPIENAYKRREALAAEQRQAGNQNPSMLFQRDARGIKIDDLINNPSMDYGLVYSGALLTKQVSDMVGNLAKEARESEEGRRKLEQLLPYQYRYAQQYGFTDEAVKRAILNEDGADEILTNAVEQVIDSSGIRNWGNDQALRDAYAYARQGLYNAIGTTQYQMLTDQYNMQLQLAEEQERIKRENTPPPEPEDPNLIAFSYFDEDGSLTSKALAELELLRGGTDGIKVSYVGNHGEVNPLTVRREIDKIFKNYRGSNPSTTYVGGAGQFAQSTMTQTAAQRDYELLKKAEQEVLAKYSQYGVTEVLPRREDEDYSIYEAAFSNPSKRYTQFNRDIIQPFLAGIDSLAHRKSYYSPNLTDYKYADEVFQEALHHWHNTDTFEGRAYKAESNGEVGSPVDFDDIIPDTSTELKNVFYDIYNPSKLLVEVKTGDGDRNRFYVDPEAFGSAVANLVDLTNGKIQNDQDHMSDDALNEAAKGTTISLKRLLNTANPIVPASSSHAES